MDEDIGEEDFLLGLENELMGEEVSETAEVTPFATEVENEHGDDEDVLGSDDSTDNEDIDVDPDVDADVEKEVVVDVNADLVEEINALKEKIAEKERVCEGSLNLVLKKRFEDVVRVLKGELQLKYALLQ